MRAELIVESDPVADGAGRVLDAVEKRWRWMHCSLSVQIMRSTMPFSVNVSELGILLGEFVRIPLV
jgi:hypothetical protein